MLKKEHSKGCFCQRNRDLFCFIEEYMKIGTTQIYARIIDSKISIDMNQLQKRLQK